MSSYQRETLMLFIMLVLAFWKIAEIFIYLMSKIGITPVISGIILFFVCMFYIRLRTYQAKIKRARKNEFKNYRNL